MPLAPLLWPPVLGASLAMVAAWVTSGSQARRWLGVTLALAPLLTVWLLPPEPVLLRAIAALVAFLGTMRVIDLRKGEWPVRERILHVLSALDTRRIVRAPPRLDVVVLAQALGWGALMAAGAAMLLTSPRHGTACWAGRWSYGVIVVYAAVSGLYRLLVLGYAAAGFRTPPLHESPILSRSVQELWGERWALPITEWLAETFFRPFARRRRPLAGLLIAFTVSAAFHAYAVWVGLGFRDGLTMTAWMFAYFVVQAAIMTIERLLGVRRWPRWAGHAWTVVWMLAISPLFVEPLVRVLGFGVCG